MAVSWPGHHPLRWLSPYLALTLSEQWGSKCGVEVLRLAVVTSGRLDGEISLTPSQHSSGIELVYHDLELLRGKVFCI